jgi:hypothetical protein
MKDALLDRSLNWRNRGGIIMAVIGPNDEQEPVADEPGLTDPRHVHPGTFDPLAGFSGGVIEGERPGDVQKDDEGEAEHPLRHVEDTELPLLDGDGP